MIRTLIAIAVSVLAVAGTVVADRVSSAGESADPGGTPPEVGRVSVVEAYGAVIRPKPNPWGRDMDTCTEGIIACGKDILIFDKPYPLPPKIPLATGDMSVGRSIAAAVGSFMRFVAEIFSPPPPSPPPPVPNL